MKTRKIFGKIIASVLCTALMLTLAGCNSEDKSTQGNMLNWSYSDLEPGDIYAEINVRGFEGVMRFVLFEGIAPEGVDAFMEAANSGYYVNRTFHRIIEDILIQGGAFNPDGGDISVTNEDKFAVETHDNARNFFGALAFAVDEHSGMNYRQFYIVTASESIDIEDERERLSSRLERLRETNTSNGNGGNGENNEDNGIASEITQLEELIRQIDRMSEEVVERYSELGGYFLLDGRTTVFGQMIDGWDVLREIASVQVVGGNLADDVNIGLAEEGMRGRPSRPANEIFIESVTVNRIPEPEPEEDEE
ncbi:MAG: peptidylprolyl isomerase [Oscillospiraceae bacterium]|nr:peptidylprolyl isomerase [Oscillospiraceae bacterium]